jgi:uncharacterized protein
MDKRSFFDWNCALGRRFNAETFNPADSAAALHAQLKPLGIEHALVWHLAQEEYSPVEGNRIATEATADMPTMLACWTWLPPETGEIAGPDELFGQMRQGGAVALRIYPENHRFVPHPLVFRSIVDELINRNVPILVSMRNNAGLYHALYDLLEAHPRLHVVLLDTGGWGEDRFFRPLVAAFPNVYLESSMLGIQDGIIEDLVARYGAERILFGSGFPDRIPEAAIMAVNHADIPDSAKEKIAMSNGLQLLERIHI